ncbi:hypothetical protein HK104_006488 [Borealophlyctis nickersoniae]|nr:hypothetical protein HK104_006488 [Borealophlyctis nickersoniae]
MRSPPRKRSRHADDDDDHHSETERRASKDDRRGSGSRDDSKKKKKDKKEDKDRSHKRKKHKRDERSDDESEDEAVKQARALIPTISEEDYYNKATQFQTWLREEKKLYFFDLSGKEAREYFAKFVKRWNKAKLDSKYYKGMISTEVAAASKSAHKWNFKNLSEAELEKARDSVDAATHSTTLFENPFRSGAGDRRGLGPSMPSSLPAGPAPGPNPRRPEDDEDMDEEDRRRYQRGMAKKQAKSARQEREAVLEELVPKETGRDAMREKRLAQTAYHRTEREVDPELPDQDLMGGDDFRSRLAAQQRSKERWEQKRAAQRGETAASLSGKVAAYKAKEQATLEMFKQMAAGHKLG